MHRRTSHNRNIHNDQYNQHQSRPGRNQLSYGEDISANDDDFWSPQSAQPQSGRQRRTSTHSADDDRDYHTEHDKRSYRPNRNQLNYGDDISAYDDDYWSNGQQRSRPVKHRRASAHSVDEDIDYWRDQNFGRGRFDDGRNRRYNNRRNENTRQSENYSDQRRHVTDYRHENVDDLRRSRYQGDGRWGVGGESRRGHYTEDASFYEYRDSRHNPNARRSARYDMEHQDDNYFDRPHTNRNSNADRYDNRRNISDNDYHRPQQRNQGRSHNKERWFDYDEECRPARNRSDAGSRDRRW